jgi:hypothetical protein
MSAVMGVVSATADRRGKEIIGEGRAAAFGLADRLCLAAAPTFAIMALLTGVFDSGPSEMLCSGASPLGGMTPMYLLMSVFHSAPWLKLISRRRSGRAPASSPEASKIPSS